jgi:hypothetical protein
MIVWWYRPLEIVVHFLSTSVLKNTKLGVTATLNYNRELQTHMIAHLSGTLLSKQATSVILEVAGVGYEVSIPLSTFL